MKYKDIILTASSNMFRSKVRTALTIIAIFIGAFTLTLTNGIGAGVSSYIDSQLGNIGADDMLIVQPKTENPFSSGPQEYNPDQAFSTDGPVSIPMMNPSDVETIRNTPGIKSAEPNIMPNPDYIEGLNGKKFRFTMQSFIDGVNVELAAGNELDIDSSENELLLSKNYAEALGFSPLESAIGQQVTLGVTTAEGKQEQVQTRISGVLEQSLMTTGSGGQSNEALTNAVYAIQTRGLPVAQTEQYMQVLARVAPDASEQEVQAVKDALNEQGFTGTTVEDQIGIIKQVIDAIVLVLNFFAGIALLAASFGIVNTLFMAVQERTKEIGLMKAMGMRSNRIFALFSIEAILLGFWGSLLGSLAGIGAGQIINNIASNSFLKDFPGFELMAFSVSSVLTIMLIIMIIAFLAGTLPARRASKKDPIEALRYE